MSRGGGVPVVWSYLEHAAERLIDEGGFQVLHRDRWPEPADVAAAAVLLREDRLGITLVALAPLGHERALRDGLRALCRAIARERRTEALGLLVLAAEGPVRREEFEELHSLNHQGGSAGVAVWVADLSRHRLFGHTGAPYGLDPGLEEMLAPREPGEPPPEEPVPAPSPAYAAPRPWVTLLLLAVIVGIWGAMTWQGGALDATERDVRLLMAWGASVRPELWLLGEPWRLLTANFIHIGLVHLALNGLSLWWVGRVVELLYGPARLLYIYLLSGVAGSMASAVLGPPAVISAGASGAIFGLLGAVLWYRISSPLGHRVAWRPLIITLVLNLGLGLALYKLVDNWNHLGGLAGGLACAAAVGTPRVDGAAPPRFALPPLWHGLVAGLLLAGAVGLTTGTVELPGAGRDLAHAILALESGRYDVAAEGLRRAVSRQPDEPELRAMLLRAQVGQGRCEEARAELTVLLSLDPAYPGARELLFLVRSCTP